MSPWLPSVCGCLTLSLYFAECGCISSSLDRVRRFWRDYHRGEVSLSPPVGLPGLCIVSVEYFPDRLLRECCPGSSSAKLLLAPLLCSCEWVTKFRPLSRHGGPPMEEGMHIRCLRFFCKGDLPLLHLFVYSTIYLYDYRFILSCGL